MKIEMMTNGLWPDDTIKVVYCHLGSPIPFDEMCHYLLEAVEEIRYHAGINIELTYVKAGVMPDDVVEGSLFIGWENVFNLLSMAQTKLRYKTFDRGIVGARMSINLLANFAKYPFKIIDCLVHEFGHVVGFRHVVDYQYGLFTVMSSQSSKLTIENRVLSYWDIKHWNHLYLKRDDGLLPIRVKVSDETDQEYRRIYVPIIGFNHPSGETRYYEGRLEFVKNQGWKIIQYQRLYDPEGFNVSHMNWLTADRRMMLLRNVHYGNRVFDEKVLRYKSDDIWVLN